MTAKEYLKELNIEDRVVNREDLSEYWKSLSQIMEEYNKNKVDSIIVNCEKCGKSGYSIGKPFCTDEFCKKYK